MAYPSGPTAPFDQGDAEDLLEEDDDAATPSAPPFDHDLPPGYETAAYGNDADLPPPSYDSLYPSNQQPLQRQMSVPSEGVTVEEAKSLLIDHCRRKCCYGVRAARQLDVANIENLAAFHYVLESHTEGRKACWSFEPYKGEPMHHYSHIPAPWDVQIVPPQPFTEEKRKVPIPETRTLRTCHKCNGRGKQRCRHCFGSGYSNCSSCGGRGTRTSSTPSSFSNRCISCHGSGRRRCVWCHGSGRVTCKTCQGNRQLVHFILLIVEWKHYTDHHVVENLEIPEKAIKKVTGDSAFFQENIVVPILNDFWIPDINTASEKLINKQFTEIKQKLQRILWQRHSVRMIPVAEINYSWRQKQGKFFVYGSEKKIFAPNYPQNCCCCCEVL